MKLTTTDELATQLRVSKKTIQRWCRERRIPHIRIGGRILFRDDDIQAAIAHYHFDAQATDTHAIPNPHRRPSNHLMVVPMEPRP